jgi:RND superfamily putative drug exporter
LADLEQELLAGIPIVLLAALTLTPALLSLLGDRFFALGHRPLSDLEHTGWLSRYLDRLAHVTQRRRGPIIAVFLAATVPFAWLTATHESTADIVGLSPPTDARAGFDVIAAEWGAAALFPTVVAGPLDQSLWGACCSSPPRWGCSGGPTGGCPSRRARG